MLEFLSVIPEIDFSQIRTADFAFIPFAPQWVNI